MPLTTSHERALTLLFMEIERAAAEQSSVLLGTPGNLAERTNAEGTHYWVRRYSDASGKRRELYLGKSDQPEVKARLDTLRDLIDATNAAIRSVRLLARAGYAVLDKKAFFALASLHNHGLFTAGALVIGTHAYGALLNHLGVRAVVYATEDVDIARRESLALPDLPSFLEILGESGVEFVEVPSLDRGKPPTSFKERGTSRFRVDLLVPSPNDEYPTIPVPELKANATGLPYLAYLLSTSQMIPLLSTHGIVMARVPTPERYAVHKLLVSQMRSGKNAKSAKDLQQAAVLLEVLSERFPGAIEDALDAVPRSARRLLKLAVRQLKSHLPPASANAWETLKDTV